MAEKSEKRKEEEKKRRKKKAGEGPYNVEPAEEPVRGPTGEEIYKV